MKIIEEAFIRNVGGYYTNIHPTRQGIALELFPMYGGNFCVAARATISIPAKNIEYTKYTLKGLLEREVGSFLRNCSAGVLNSWVTCVKCYKARSYHDNS